MSLTPVKSSNIRAVGYDHGSKTLTVEFNSGGKHRYENVSPETHAGMMASDSVGRYFHANIRNARKSSKVES